MNVLWTKDKYQKIFSTDNLVFHASGDGATAGRCCRLCGGDASLKSFADTYLLEGVEGRYDQLLYECFGVRVSPSDSLICEWCVRQLRNTGKFRALVYSAFGMPNSSTNLTPPGSAKSINNAMEDETAIITYKDMVDLLNTKARGSPLTKKKFVRGISSVGRRANVQCVICKQKYPSMIQSSEEDFTCSRCKKNGEKRSLCRKCNVAMPFRLLNEHMELHAKAEMRRKNSLQKKPSSMKNQEMQKNRSVPKYKCPVCPKRYMTAQHLAEHIKCMHGNGTNTFCEICGKDVKNNETFEKHIQNHAEQMSNLQFPPKAIRSKRSLKTNRIAREKGSV